MDQFEIDTLVIGAGVVGLAIARHLACLGCETLVIERENLIGSGISSRNSEVIHAGIYYPTNSLKARLCIEGKNRLYRYCDSRKIAYQRTGKLIVATCDEELPILEKNRLHALSNEMADLTFIDGEEALRREPALNCVGALWSPTTGIIDSHGLMLSLQGELEDHGGAIAFGNRVIKAEIRAEHHCVVIEDQTRTQTLIRCRHLINAAGLQAPLLAKNFDGLDQQLVPQAYLCKGNYYSLVGKAPFQHLIYPVPQSAGLGVHLTLDLGGQARFGPDVEWIEQENYDVDPARSLSFYDAIRRYWPALPDGALVPGYSGIRPKIQAPNEPAKDFVIQGPDDHQIPGLVNLFGIESPGLTSSLAIAGKVAQTLGLNGEELL